MLLKEIFLKENADLPEEVYNFVHEHCQPYLSMVNNDLSKLMYRGVSPEFISRTPAIPGVPDSSIVPGHYRDRRPRDTHPDIHDYINKKFAEVYGTPFRNGLFATGSNEQAEEYGESVIIFPIGNFKFCWSPTIRDVADHAPSFVMSRWHREDTFQVFDRLIENDYKTTDLSAAIASGNEIMLYCDKCLMYIPHKTEY